MVPICISGHVTGHAIGHMVEMTCHVTIAIHWEECGGYVVPEVAITLSWEHSRFVLQVPEVGREVPGGAREGV